MNIIESVKTNLPLRRPYMQKYYENILLLQDAWKLSSIDFSANDWEVEVEERKELSWKEIETMLNRSITGGRIILGTNIPNHTVYLSGDYSKIKKELGFGEGEGKS